MMYQPRSDGITACDSLFVGARTELAFCAARLRAPTNKKSHDVIPSLLGWYIIFWAHASRCGAQAYGHLSAKRARSQPLLTFPAIAALYASKDSTLFTAPLPTL